MYAAIGREPENTNYTPGFTGTLDYMFLLDGSSVKPTSLLRSPTRGLCGCGGRSAHPGPRSVQVTLQEYETGS
jgi:mRNA deadenylase 3'-5' endonuclease subunit Ccr4